MSLELIRGWAPVAWQSSLRGLPGLVLRVELPYEARRNQNSVETGTLVHGAAAAGHSVESDCCVELRQFRLEPLVDQQQRLQRTANVAVAVCHDLVDGRFACIGNHGWFSDCTLEQKSCPPPLFLWMLGTVSGVGHPIRHADTWRKCQRIRIKWR